MCLTKKEIESSEYIAFQRITKSGYLDELVTDKSYPLNKEAVSPETIHEAMTYLIALNDIYELIERSEAKASLPEVISKKVYELNPTLSNNAILYLTHLLLAQHALAVTPALFTHEIDESVIKKVQEIHENFTKKTHKILDYLMIYQTQLCHPHSDTIMQRFKQLKTPSYLHPLHSIDLFNATPQFSENRCLILAIPDLVNCTIRARTSSHTGHSYFNPVGWVGGTMNKLYGYLLDSCLVVLDGKTINQIAPKGEVFESLFKFVTLTYLQAFNAASSSTFTYDGPYSKELPKPLQDASDKNQKLLSIFKKMDKAKLGELALTHLNDSLDVARLLETDDGTSAESTSMAHT